MARASTPTLLSLQRYAAIIGIPPVHFAGAYADTVWTMKGACEEVWPQYDWQKDQVASRESLAQAIADAEYDIARQLGYWPAPKFVTEEEYLWGRPGYVPFSNIRTRWGKVISPGRRATTLIDDEATVTFSDDDNDGWDETATITASTSVTNIKEIKVYFAGKGAAREWEIRPVRSITIASGVVTIVADSWLFIKPELWEAYPTSAEFRGVNIETTDNFVEEVAIYREYVDTSVSVEHFWLTGDCEGPSCERSTAESCFVVVNGSWVRPALTTQMLCDYDDYPSGGKLWYLSGDQSDRYLQNEVLDPLSDYWAQAIVWLATARMELPPCSCGVAQMYFDQYRKDMALITTSANNRNRFVVTQMLLNENPFGTKVGEMKAWERVLRANPDDGMRGAVI